MAREFRKAKRCITQGKIKFGSESQALSFARRVGKPWMTAYFHPTCSKWHLTGGVRGDAATKRTLGAI